MSCANLDLVRSIYADWERGDYSRTDWADPEIEFVQTDGPPPGSWTGLPAMAAAWRETLNAFSEFRAGPEEYRDLDDERVLVLTQFTGRGRTSGLELGQVWETTASLFHVSDGRVTRLVLYWGRERALADLGLEDG